MSVHLSSQQRALLATFYAIASTPTTLADLDEAQDDSELLRLVEQRCNPYCQAIDFRDDNRKHGCRALEFQVTVSVYNGYTDRDEDGYYRDTSTIQEVIWVAVRTSDTLESIAERVLAEVKSIDCSIHA